MKKLILLAMLTVGALTLSVTSEAKADHRSGCGPSYGGGSYYSGYDYAPRYTTRSYYAPVYSYNYGPSHSYGYAYPSSGIAYSRPGLSISIGSGYRGYSYGNYGSYGGGGHHHHHHR
ncbi:MAG: hypothetical protein ACKV2Q_34105 [Planctomycetaceae bacterium]